MNTCPMNAVLHLESAEIIYLRLPPFLSEQKGLQVIGGKHLNPLSHTATGLLFSTDDKGGLITVAEQQMVIQIKDRVGMRLEIKCKSKRD